jgi:flavin reductase (DIM6/NTAB) family NADH-FMN oxidoreductase RutF
MADSFAEPPRIDAGTFWKTLGQRAIGVTVVTAEDANGPRGLLALSASHVSADPPRLLVSVDRKTSALETIRVSGAFAVNFLPDSAGDLAKAFGGGASGAERFAGSDWTKLSTGAPVLADALGAFDCQVERLVELDDTVVVIGRVVEAAARTDGSPLVFFRGKTYGGGDLIP